MGMQCWIFSSLHPILAHFSRVTTKIDPFNQSVLCITGIMTLIQSWESCQGSCLLGLSRACFVYRAAYGYSLTLQLKTKNKELQHSRKLATIAYYRETCLIRCYEDEHEAGRIIWWLVSIYLCILYIHDIGIIGGTHLTANKITWVMNQMIIEHFILPMAY